MKKISLLISILFLVSCSESKQVELELKSKLGNAVYRPVKNSTPHVLMPSAFCMVNSYSEGDVLYAPYYTDRVVIRANRLGYILTSEKFTNSSKDFRMYIFKDRFELLDDSGKSTEYEKQ